MKREVLTVAQVVLTAVGVVEINYPLSAQATGAYNHKEPIQQVQGANTRDRYQLLASWYRDKERSYRSKAASEQTEYEELRKRAAGKYPTPADLEKRRYEYDRYKADQMAKLASGYEQKSQVERQVEAVAPGHAKTAGLPGTAGINPTAKVPQAKILN